MNLNESQRISTNLKKPFFNSGAEIQYDAFVRLKTDEY